MNNKEVNSICKYAEIEPPRPISGEHIERVSDFIARRNYEDGEMNIEMTYVFVAYQYYLEIGKSNIIDRENLESLRDVLFVMMAKYEIEDAPFYEKERLVVEFLELLDRGEIARNLAELDISDPWAHEWSIYDSLLNAKRI